MKHFLRLTISLLLCSTYSFSQTDPTPFNWLTGSWQGGSGTELIYENWQQVDEQLLLGEGYFVSGGDTVVREQLRLQKIGAYWCYIATVNKGRPTLFTHIKTEKGKMSFENPEHDFPQRITYVLQKDGSLLAFVEGKEKGNPRREEFRMKKVYAP